MKKQKHQGTQMGIGCVAIGIIFLIVDLIMIMNGKTFPVLLIMGPPLVLAGIAFLLMPGIDPPISVQENKGRKPGGKWRPLLIK